MSGSSHSVAARKLIPQKLEDDLHHIPKFKPKMPEIKPRTVADILDDSVERAMFDEIMGPVKNFRQRSLPGMNNVPSTTSNGIGANSDTFSGSLVSRLASIEAEAKDLRRQLAEKSILIDELQVENKELRDSVTDDLYLLDEIKRLKTHNLALESQINEMEEFLDDYGLVWVGNSDSKSTESNIDCKSAKTTNGDGEDIISEKQYELLAKRINELNMSTAAEPSKIMKEGEKKARLVNPLELLDKITITAYRNGLMIQRGPFREAGSSSCQLFMKDIIDGYFPSEFREEFPEGIVLNLIDKHSDIYNIDKDMKGGQMNANQFLHRLPKTLIRDGNIVDIREEVGSKLGAGSAGNKIATKGSIIVNTPACISCSDAKRVSILVKWIDGSQLQIQMFEEDVIGDLRSQIIDHFNRVANRDRIDVDVASFELRSAYPPRILVDSLSMLDAGLVPNGTVHTRRI